MRRHDREITDRSALDDIIRRHNVLYLALRDADEPYVIPLSYGYDGSCLYLHCAPVGRKLDLIRRDPRVSFAIEAEYQVRAADVACSWGFDYCSVVGTGEATIVEDADEKRQGLDVLMSHFSDQPQTYKDGGIEGTTVLRVRVTSLTGKRNGAAS